MRDRRDALEAGDEHDLLLVERVVDPRRAHLGDLRLAVDGVGDDPRLRAGERDRLVAEVGDRHRAERVRDPLADRDQHVVLARLRPGRDLVREPDQLVGRVAHRREDADDAVAALARLDEAPRDVLDLAGVGDRGAAELHHDEVAPAGLSVRRNRRNGLVLRRGHHSVYGGTAGFPRRPLLRRGVPWGRGGCGESVVSPSPTERTRPRVDVDGFAVSARPVVAAAERVRPAGGRARSAPGQASRPDPFLVDSALIRGGATALAPQRRPAPATRARPGGSRASAGHARVAQQRGRYISRRPESARPSVTSSAYSRSPPTGRPLASRVTRTRPRSRSAR